MMPDHVPTFPLLIRVTPVQLVINTFGASLRKQGEQFVITAGDKKFTVSAAPAPAAPPPAPLDAQRPPLMGLEGSAGRASFRCLGQLMPEGFRFDARSRQPAADGFNATLNYSYGVLYSLVERACVCAGL